MAHAARHRRWPLIAVLLLVLLVGAGLRLYRLPELPLGIHYDEAANGILAAEIASGDRAPVFIRAYTGKEVLFFFWTGLWMRLAGQSVLALRLGAASAGLLTVAAAVWSVRELLHGRRHAVWAAVLTGAFLATSFWHVVLSRYGFRAVTQPLLQALTVAALWRGLRLSLPPPGEETTGRRSAGWGWLGLAGLFFGLTAYTYLAARAFPIPVAIGLVALVIVDKGHRKARLRQIALFIAVASATLAPLAYFWLANPGTFWVRTQQVAAANWRDAWQGVRACVAMFFVRGDPYIRFNIPHRPLFGPAVAALFCVGLATVIWSWVRHARDRDDPHPEQPTPGSHLCLSGTVFLVSVLPVMLLPSALAVGEVTPSNLRSAGLLPFAYSFAAVGVVSVAAIVKRWAPGVVNPWVWIAILTLGLGGATAGAYFADWAPSPALYDASDGDLVDVAAYLNQSEDTSGAPIFVASKHYRHPTLAFLARDYGDILWLTGGQTVVFPHRGGAHLIVPRSAAQDLPWIEGILPGEPPVAAARGPDERIAYSVYRVPASGSPEPSSLRPADFAHTVELIGYDVVGEPASGGPVELAAWWRVLSVPENGDLGPTVRLVDPWGSLWAEASPFHYPGEQWVVGDVIVDHLTLRAGLGAPPGEYGVRMSLYSAHAGSALPVLDTAGRYAGTWVELPIALAPGASVFEGDEDLNQLAEVLGIRNRLDKRIGDLTLAGANLDSTSIRPGDRLRATLFWGAGSSELPEYEVELSLGESILYRGAPVHGAYPFGEWTAGQVLIDRYDPRVPRETPPGEYGLSLRLHGPEIESTEAQRIGLGVVAVQAIDRSFSVPASVEAQSAAFGQEIELLGYDLAADRGAPGDTIAVTLYWSAQAEMAQDYTIFVHLVGPDGMIAGQHDGQPAEGTYPTSLWMVGEVVADVHEVAIRSDATAGEHWIEVGVYVADTGTRLVDGVSGDDAVRLQSISVAAP